MNDLDPLAQFTALASDDDVKRNLELTCDVCGIVICDIEHDDSLSSLANTADQHWREAHGPVTLIVTVTGAASPGEALDAVTRALDDPMSYGNTDVNDWDVTVERSTS